MSKKRLYSRLNDFFTGFEENSPALPAEFPAQLEGWSWECDGNGVYSVV
jgi:hypothetical protein